VSDVINPHGRQVIFLGIRVVQKHAPLDRHRQQCVLIERLLVGDGHRRAAAEQAALFERLELEAVERDPWAAQLGPGEAGEMLPAASTASLHDGSPGNAGQRKWLGTASRSIIIDASARQRIRLCSKD